MEKSLRCVNCFGEKTFNPDKKVLVCERCGSQFPIKGSKGGIVRREYTPSYIPVSNQETIIKYTCETCGTKSVFGSDVEVKRCSSCGNTTLKRDKSLSVVPDAIIPFEISRKRAGELFRNWVGSRKFAPNDLKQMAKLEKISGLYTPVWNWNFKSIFKYTGMAFNLKTDSNGNSETREYPLNKVKETLHENVVKTANTRMSDLFLDGLGEYDFSKLRPYSTEYLLGFAGIETNIDIHKVYNNLEKDIAETNEWRAKNRIHDEYDGVENLVCTTRFRDVTFNYAYIPVWANHYTYKGKEYHCFINGQTGKATGKSPKSAIKILGLISGILAGIIIGSAVILGIVSRII